MYRWNEPFKIVMELKQQYISTFGLDTMDFQVWLDNVKDPKYRDIFSCLQFNQKDNLLLIRYGIAAMQRSMWTDPDSLYRECRSLVIDLDKEAIVLAPFRKFFNLNEVPENEIAAVSRLIEHARVIEVANKLDGSMQSARYYNGEVIMTGSMALSPDSSWRLQHGYTMLTDNYIDMLKTYDYYTFIFEYISLADAHVVRYKKEEEGLYLIGMRDVFTGNEVSYKSMTKVANAFNVPVVELENEKTLAELVELSNTEDAHEKEGWVLNIDGHKVKIKCDDYVNVHKLLDRLSSANVVIKAVATNTFDDLIAKVPKECRAEIEDIAHQIMEYQTKVVGSATRLHDTAVKHTDTKKDFMLFIEEQEPCSDTRTYARGIYLGLDQNVLRGKNRFKKASEIGIQLKGDITNGK